MEKRPFLVNVEIEFAIFAENEDAIYNHPDLRRAVEEALYSSDSCISFIDPLDRIPNGWDESCLVYGTDKDITLEEALNWKPKEPEIIDKYTMLFSFMEDK